MREDPWKAHRDTRKREVADRMDRLCPPPTGSGCGCGSLVLSPRKLEIKKSRKFSLLLKPNPRLSVSAAALMIRAARKCDRFRDNIASDIASRTPLMCE